MIDYRLVTMNGPLGRFGDVQLAISMISSEYQQKKLKNYFQLIVLLMKSWAFQVVLVLKQAQLLGVRKHESWV